MLRPWLAISLALLTGACADDEQAIAPPNSAEARYRLLYNDTLVGSALFVLDVDAGGRYRIDAFTVPAGEMRREGPHEVLESSQGVLDAADVRPTMFEHSVMHGDSLALVRLEFDWQRRALRLHGPDGEQAIALLPGTHDRLSYLLAARHLAASGEGRRLIQVASVDASEESQLEVAGRESIDVPSGRYDAVGVRRITPDGDETRMLWYAPDLSPLPLRVLQSRDGNTVDMQLEEVSRRASGPR